MKRDTWTSRSTFILAAIGSAVGLGNVWRFPGLVAKHGGGTFLLVYLVAMVVMGMPLLMMEIAVGRNLKQGSPGALRGLNKKLESIGWIATSNAFVIVSYYAVVFGWVIIMTIFSFKFAGLTGNPQAAGELFPNLIQTTWKIEGFGTIPTICFIAVIIAWLLIYYCIRDGAKSVGKVVKYTVFVPIVLLAILAVKGMTMTGALEGLTNLFVPDVASLKDVTLWVDAIGQVFYSMSIMGGVMFAYGSFLDDKTNIVKDTIIIALSDMAVSILSGIVMFTTMSGVGMMDAISDSGIATAFVIYPQAIVRLTNIGWINAIFGFIFYLTLVTLAVDSALSFVEGFSTSISDRFKTSRKKTTIGVCIVAGIASLTFVNRAGMACIDIVDNWTNQYNMIIIGILECIAVGWIFKSSKVCAEINKNTDKLIMPKSIFKLSVKYISPILLTGLLVWNMFRLFYQDRGVYSGYPLWSNFVFGWFIMILIFSSGFVAKSILNRKKKHGFVDEEITWNEE